MNATHDFDLDAMLRTVRRFSPQCRRRLILTHPDNVELIRRQLDGGEDGISRLYGLELRGVPYLDRTKWTGKYVLPDGRVVEAKDVVVPWGRFAEWTEADISWLLVRGIVRKDMEMLVYELDDRPLFDMLTAPIFSPILFSTF